MTNEEAKARLKVVKSELDMYYNPKAEGHELIEGAKVYSAKNYDELYREHDKLTKQLNEA